MMCHVLELLHGTIFHSWEHEMMCHVLELLHGTIFHSWEHEMMCHVLELLHREHETMCHVLELLHGPIFHSWEHEMRFELCWDYSRHDRAKASTTASKLHGTRTGIYLLITKLHSILSVANLLAH